MAGAIEDAFYAELIADQTGGSFYDDLTGRIYMLEAPTNAALPLAVVTPISSLVTPYYFDAQDAREWAVQISLWGHHDAGLDALQAISAKLFTVLQRTEISPTGFDRGFISCTDDGTSSTTEDGLQILTEWLVVATETS